MMKRLEELSTVMDKKVKRWKYLLWDWD
jgi:hypothetical protein